VIPQSSIYSTILEFGTFKHGHYLRAVAKQMQYIKTKHYTEIGEK
jgi:hypothetical protein